MKSTKEFFQNKKILIYGYGKTGKSAFNFLKTKNNLKVFDDNLPLTNLPYNKKFTRGSDSVRNFDYVLLSPGINYRKCLLSNEIIKNKEKIISDLDVFYKSFPESFFILVFASFMFLALSNIWLLRLIVVSQPMTSSDEYFLF